MVQPERKKYILEMLNQHNKVKASEVAERSAGIWRNWKAEAI